MELDDFKKAWSQYSEQQAAKSKVEINAIADIIGKRTLDISERIERNIRIGVIVMLAWTSLNFGVDFIVTPLLDGELEFLKSHKDLLMWSSIFEAFLYLLFFVSIGVFWMRFKKLKETHLNNDNLRDKIVYLIKGIKSYKRMFYILLFMILIFTAILFGSGFYAGFTNESSSHNIELSQINFLGWAIFAAFFIVSLGILIAFYCLLFTYFFNRLYGRHLKQLQKTLDELDEHILND